MAENTLPRSIPANGYEFPKEEFERLTGSMVIELAHGQENTVTLADLRKGTYYFQHAPGGRGRGTWILRR